MCPPPTAYAACAGGNLGTSHFLADPRKYHFGLLGIPKVLPSAFLFFSLILDPCDKWPSLDMLRLTCFPLLSHSPFCKHSRT